MSTATALWGAHLAIRSALADSLGPMSEEMVPEGGEEPFAGCWARLDRAGEHFKAFATEWGKFLNHHPYRVYVEVRPTVRASSVSADTSQFQLGCRCL